MLAGFPICPLSLSIQDASCVHITATSRECTVSQLYQMRLRVEEKIKADQLDPMQVKGQIGLKAGLLVSLISANTPDNPASVAKFRSAVKEVLNLAL